MPGIRYESIDNAYFEINTSNAMASSTVLDLYNVKTNWKPDEEYLTWNRWQSEGIDELYKSYGLTDSTEAGLLGFEIKSKVIDWFNNPEQNNGIELRLNDSSDYQNLSIYSCDYTDDEPSERPAIIIEYTRKAEPPIILLHGAAGSKLYDSSGTELWPRVFDPRSGWFHLQLALNINPELEARWWDNVGYQEINQDIYGGIRDYLISQGYDVKEIPYDWRLDINDIQQRISSDINFVKAKYNSDKVDIVAHSMGGLVARKYILNHRDQVDKLITVGTPNLGAPKAYNTLFWGDKFGLLFTIKSIIRDISRTFPSAYELLPAKTYFDFYPNGYIKDEYWDLSKGSSLYDLTTNSLNNSGMLNLNYLKQSASFQDSLDFKNQNLYPTKVYRIVGTGLGTLGQTETYKLLNGETALRFRYTNGDETVPEFSASLKKANAGLDYSKGAQVFYVKGTHAFLMSTDTIQQMVENIMDSDDIPDLAPGISKTPFKFSGEEVSINCPVDVHVYDESGRHAGPISDGVLENNIPNVSYELADQSKGLFLPDGSNYRIELKATDNGTFNVTIGKRDGDIIKSTFFYDSVNVNTNSRAYTDSNFNQIQLDLDGNGSIDKIVYPNLMLNEYQSNETIAPNTNTILTGLNGNNGWFRSDVNVNLVANDEPGGSGVYKTTYQTNIQPEHNIYTNPFMITREGINWLSTNSQDRNLNVEWPLKTSTIKIDKTNPIIITPKYEDQYIYNYPLKIQYRSEDYISGVDFVTATLNGVPVKDGQTVNLLKLGENHLFIKAQDIAGNVETKDIKFMVYYNIIWIQPLSIPDKTHQIGSTIPIKFIALDYFGTFVHDEKVNVMVEGNNNKLPDPGFEFGDGTNHIRISDSDPLYIVNLHMPDYPWIIAGNYYRAYTFFQGVYHPFPIIFYVDYNGQ